MANDDLFLSPTDIAGFQQSVAGTDPYGISGRSLLSWQPDMSTWSPQTAGITSFAKAFLGGLLQNYARSNASNQLQSVVGILPQLQADPYNTAAPEGVNSDAFNLLKGTAIVKDAERKELAKAQGNAAVAELLKSVLGPAVSSGAIDPKAAIVAARTGQFPESLTSADPQTNPNSPGYKLAQDKQKLALDLDSRITDSRNFLRTAGAPYITARENLDLLTKNFKESNPASDLVYAIAANKILDPGAIVRPDDVANIQAVIPYLERSIKGFRNYVSPEGTISPEGKAIIIRTIAPKLEAMGQNYKGLFDTETSRLKGLNADPSLLAAYAYQPFDVNAFLGGPSIDRAALLQEAAALKAGGMSQADASAALRKKYGSAIGG
jgi:hypothetical protein